MSTDNVLFLIFLLLDTSSFILLAGVMIYLIRNYLKGR